jgi:predicted ATPase
MQIRGFRVESLKEIIHVSLNANSAEKTSVSIADVGFGVSQVFPILLEGLRIEKGTTLILEQPEIHLHPKLQMFLSDYLLSLALSRKGVIVETHSDHMINRLVRRIVEDTSHNLDDLVQIYFVKNSENGSIVEPVEIDPVRGIVNWPEEFFDQGVNELEEIMRAGIQKRRSFRSA